MKFRKKLQSVIGGHNIIYITWSGAQISYCSVVEKLPRRVTQGWKLTCQTALCLQDPAGRLGGGEDLPEELLPPLSLQTWHVEPTDSVQAEMTVHLSPVTSVTSTATTALYVFSVIPSALWVLAAVYHRWWQQQRAGSCPCCSRYTTDVPTLTGCTVC